MHDLSYLFVLPLADHRPLGAESDLDIRRVLRLWHRIVRHHVFAFFGDIISRLLRPWHRIV